MTKTLRRFDYVWDGGWQENSPTGSLCEAEEAIAAIDNARQEERTQIAKWLQRCGLPDLALQIEKGEHQ